MAYDYVALKDRLMAGTRAYYLIGFSKSKPEETKVKELQKTLADAAAVAFASHIKVAVLATSLDRSVDDVLGTMEALAIEPVEIVDPLRGVSVPAVTFEEAELILARLMGG